MKSAFYRKKWSTLKAQIITPHDFRRLSQQIAYSFMDAYLKDCHYEDSYIELLCEMTTFAQDTDLSDIAARALFSIIIESLCDDFEELQTETYNRLIAQLITLLRQLPSAQALNDQLNLFGLDRNLDVSRFLRFQ